METNVWFLENISDEIKWLTRFGNRAIFFYLRRHFPLSSLGHRTS